MKNVTLLLLLITLIACDSDKGLNCFQAAGDIIQEEVTVAPFSKIVVFERTQLIIEQGPVQKVVIETGENLLNDIDVKVGDDQLIIINNNGCNIVRDYGLTKVIVTSPNVTEIRNSSGLPVESVGVLRFPELILLSEDRENEDEFHSDGDFRLQLAVEKLQIVSSGLSKFYLSGTADVAFIGLFSGDTRVEAPNLEVLDLNVYHRSTNEIIIFPVNSIVGELRSLGNVIAKNRPSIVEVEEFYTGKLIFED